MCASLFRCCLSLRDLAWSCSGVCGAPHDARLTGLSVPQQRQKERKLEGEDMDVLRVRIMSATGSSSMALLAQQRCRAAGDDSSILSLRQAQSTHHSVCVLVYPTCAQLRPAAENHAAVWRMQHQRQRC